MVRPEFLHTLRAGEEGQRLSKKDILFLLSTKGKEEKEILYGTAERVREAYIGNSVHLRGIIEFSNFCVQNCLYCGLRRDNHELVRYRMAPAEIVRVARKGKSRGLHTLVLQSGEDPWFTRGRMAELIREIKDQTGLAITLSVGERTYGEYLAWKKAGVDRYLLKHETSNPRLFRRLRPGRELGDRLISLRWLQELGYEVGSGNMVGLPGQTMGDLVEDIQIFKKQDFDMIGIGPFLAHPRTPLNWAENGQLDDTLKVLAITRIITRDTNLPATTALRLLDPRGQRKALLAGANVLMPDLTPPGYRKHYQIYPGRDKKSPTIEEIRQMTLALRRKISQGAGGRVRF